MGCPVHNEYEEFGKTKVDGLSSEKETSTILKNTDEKWEYPSEGQLFKALQKKHDNIEKQDMHQIVHIHNTVNELAWQKVVEWEKLRNSDKSILSKFEGAPSYMTPKALWNHYILGYKKPFDVHIWQVVNNNKKVDYYLDFYKGKYSDAFNSVYVDVRPRLNTFEGIKLRFLRLIEDTTQYFKAPTKKD